MGSLVIGGKTVSDITIGGKSVQTIAVNGSIIWYKCGCLYIQNTSANAGTFSIILAEGTPVVPDLEYSTNGTTWTSVDLSSTWTLSVAAGAKVYLRGDNPNGFNQTSGASYYKFNMDVNHIVGGNIMSLISKNNYDGVTSIPDCSFDYLFHTDSGLTSASFTLGNVTTIGQYSFYQTFRGCANLTTVPDYSGVTTFSSGALLRCFYDCTSITSTPRFTNLSTIGQRGFESCFKGCSSLNTVYAPNVSTWDTSVFNTWLDGVAATGTLYKASSVTIPTGTSGVPSGWTVVGVVETPVITHSAVNTYTVTCNTSGATLYYTTDGTTPTTSSTEYTSPIVITESCTIKVIGIKQDWISSMVASQSVTYEETVATPVITCSNNNITIDDDTVGATIYYTTDGTTPTTSSSVYSSSFAITQDTTIKAYGVKTGLIDSPVATLNAEYELGYFYVKDESGNGLTMNLVNSGVSTNYITVDYSTDATNWTTHTFTSSTETLSMSVPANGKLYIKGNNSDWSVYQSRYYHFVGSDDYSVGGHINSLLDETMQLTTLGSNQWTFFDLFATDSHLVKCSDLIFDFTYNDYWQFNGFMRDCVNLSGTGFTIPNMTIGSNSNWSMNNIFKNTLITTIRVEMTTWSTGAFNAWLDGVPATGTFYKPTATSISSGINGIPSGWTVVNF